MNWNTVLTGAVAFALGMFIYSVAAPVLEDVTG